MTSKDLHTAIIDSNFTVGRQYIGRCSQVYRGKKAIHVACGETYTKVALSKSTIKKNFGENFRMAISLANSWISCLIMAQTLMTPTRTVIRRLCWHVNIRLTPGMDTVLICTGVKVL